MLSMTTDIYQSINGQVYFVGDIHGHYSSLMQSLSLVGFDEKRDLLISTGDLIDRGPESYQVIELLNQPWFHAVKGNHEQIAIDMFAKLDSGDVDDIADYAEYWKRVGGDWFFELSDLKTQELLTTKRELIEAIPLSLTVHLVSGERVGVVHANPLPGNWERNTASVCDIEKNHLLWSRVRAKGSTETTIKGIDAVCVGHTVVQPGHPMVKGNVVHIDYGAWRDGKPFKLHTGQEITALTKEKKLFNLNTNENQEQHHAGPKISIHQHVQR